jgi:arylsulfatase A-like enzyme
VDETTVLAAVDMFPTLCSIAGAPMPPGPGPDGEDRSAALRGTLLPSRARPLFWEYGRNGTSFDYPSSRNGGREGDRSPNVAVREGRWKLLVNSDGSGAELYDLAADPSERHDLARERPAEAARLRDLALGWRRSLP